MFVCLFVCLSFVLFFVFFFTFTSGYFKAPPEFFASDWNTISLDQQYSQTLRSSFPHSWVFISSWARSSLLRTSLLCRHAPPSSSPFLLLLLVLWSVAWWHKERLHRKLSKILKAASLDSYGHLFCVSRMSAFESFHSTNKRQVMLEILSPTIPLPLPMGFITFSILC